MEKENSFGTRFLVDPEKTFDHNSWDNVEFTDEDLHNAQEIVQSQQNNPVKDSSIYLDNPREFWDSFYGSHEDRFFKDRHWFSHEFPELYQPGIRVLEMGCGVGNSYFPLLEENPTATVFACDFSQKAINTLQSDIRYSEKRGKAFCHDITLPIPKDLIPDHSVDVVTMIFVMSAIHPGRQHAVFENIKRILKPGTGIILYRDYGQFDMTQLRLKKERFIQEGLYVRGDGTLVHYPTLEEVKQLAETNALNILSLKVDRRLLVNRGKKLKMYRIWHQGKFST